MDIRSMLRSSARPLCLGVPFVLSLALSACREEQRQPLESAEAAGTLVEYADYAPPSPPPLATPADSASVSYDRCFALYHDRELLQQQREQGTTTVAADTAQLVGQLDDASERYAVCRWGYATFGDPRPLP